MSFDFSKASINTPLFSLCNYHTSARVVDICDGDTIVAVIPFQNDLFRIYIRLADIDTCELSSKHPELQDKAKMARLRLFELITGRNMNYDNELTRSECRDMLSKDIYLVTLKCRQFDKYGRTIADVYVKPDSKPISDILVDDGMAYNYSGKTKLTEEQQLALFGLIV